MSPEKGKEETISKVKYPNLAFQQKNELRMLAKLKHNVDPEVQDLLPEAVELAKQKKRERLQQSLNEPVKTNIIHLEFLVCRTLVMDQSNTCHPLHIILNQINLEKPNRGTTRIRKLYW